MSCPSEVMIGDNLVFSTCTHDPDTGVLTDADAAPTYRVYEDETGTAILTGSMAPLDDANTTGFYAELIGCTTGNGFEDGKTYTIYIAATVDGDEGGICYGFKAVDAAARWNAIADALLGRTNGIETGVTPKQALQRIGANAAGKLRGAGTGTETVVGMDGSTDRMEFTVTAAGNRTAVSYDP